MLVLAEQAGELFYLARVGVEEGAGEVCEVGVDRDDALRHVLGGGCPVGGYGAPLELDIADCNHINGATIS